MEYDFKSARNRINELIMFYRFLKSQGILTPKAKHFLLDSILEIQDEIETAYKKRLPGNGNRSVQTFMNINVPILPHPAESGNKEVSV